MICLQHHSKIGINFCRRVIVTVVLSDSKGKEINVLKRNAVRTTSSVSYFNPALTRLGGKAIIFIVTYSRNSNFSCEKG